ncbi:hypothetical protein HDV05_005602 [Chytridiales sp. JEL 0842]|nr:hypothetical protein HDV05_005602 [Chytridiales sp. JEL 0842]
MDAAITQFFADPASQSAQAAVTQIVQGILQGPATLLNLVERLGPQMTSSDPFERANAIALLSSVIREGRKALFEKVSVSVLLEFYVERLHDQPSVAELLSGLLSMLEEKAVPTSDVAQIPRKIFAELNVQTFPQPVRLSCFNIIQILLRDHLHVMKRMNDDFLLGFITSMDGEKDPRNLLLCFNIVKVITHEFDISKHAESLFDAVYCYFPITFRAPPNGSLDVTAEDLKAALRDCLSGSPLFGQYSMPAVVEKLSSTSGSARRDSIDLLSVGVPVFGAACVQPHVQEIWKLLKYEVYNAADDSLAQSALAALKSLTSTLSLSTTQITGKALSPLEEFLQLAVKEITRVLEDAELKQAAFAAPLLQALCGASESACYYLTFQCVPIIMDAIKSEMLMPKRKKLVQILNGVLSSTRGIYSTTSQMDVDDAPKSALLQYKDAIIRALQSYVQTADYPPLKTESIIGLSELLQVSNMMNSEEIALALTLLTDVTLNLADEETVRDAAVDALKAYSLLNPSVMLSTCISSIVRTFENEEDLGKVRSSLHVLVKVSCEASILSHVITKVVGKIEATHDNLPYLQVLCSSLESILEQRDTFQKQSKESTNVFPDLYSVIVPSVLRIVMASNTAGAQDDNQQVEAAKLAFKVFVDGDLGDIAEGYMNIDKVRHEGGSMFLNVDNSHLSVVFSAIICNLRPTVKLPVTSLNEFVGSFMESCLSENASSTLVESACSIVASVLNKLKGSESKSLLAYIVEQKLIPVITNKSTSGVLRSNYLNLYIWITKSLLLSNPSDASLSMASFIVSLIPDADMGPIASSRFFIITKEDPLQNGLLTKESFAVVRLLHRQRLFTYLVPKLLQLFHQSEKAMRPRYLRVLSDVLQSIPKALLLTELEPLAPILLQALDTSDNDLVLATLGTMEMMISDMPQILESHVQTFLPSLLKLSTFNHPEYTEKNKSPPPVQVRVAAVKCLGLVASSNINYTVLHPLKQSVLKALVLVLDDPKRVVRKEAANSRLKWYFLLGPKNGN